MRKYTKIADLESACSETWRAVNRSHFERLKKVFHEEPSPANELHQ